MSSSQQEESQGANTTDAKHPDQQPFDNLVPEPFHIHEHGGVANETRTLGVDPSLVPDLMKVYENMSVRKTPQTRSSSHALHGAAAAAVAVSRNAHSGSTMEDSLPMDDTAMASRQWNYGNITIPPPYPVPYDPTTGQAEQQEESSPIPQADSPPSVEQPASARKRSSKDSGSVSSTKRRKKSAKDKKNDDERWKKRFTWPDELHRDFVSAIFDIGLKHATPSSVLEQMPPLEQITTERIKSHLQKYRLHRRKSKEEFMSCYEDTVERLKAKGGKGITSLSSGQAAGYVTHAVENEDPEDPTTSEEAGKSEETSSPAVGNAQQQVQDGDTILTIPRLTEEERQSPVGTSLGYLLGLFFSLKRQLQEQRQPTISLGVEAPTGTSAPAGTLGSASRSNLEAGSLMKREMESQMKFQNKMRALKQEELSKLAEVPSSDGGTKQPAFQDASSAMSHQRPGDSVEPHPSTKNRSASEDEEFWNTPAFDGELFDFLME